MDKGLKAIIYPLEKVEILARIMSIIHISSGLFYWEDFMAQRRMFNLKIVDTDKFLEMPSTTRLLYFDLSMRADDDGFVDNPKKIMKMTGGTEDDLKVLFSKEYVIPFASGVCVIKDWKIHNYIANDRYHETHYLEEKKQLKVEDNGVYTRCIQGCIQSDDSGKVRLGKDSIDKDNIYIGIFDFWNSHNIVKHKKLTDKMKTKINTALKEYTEEDIKKAIENYSIVINNPKDYYFNYLWPLEDFLQRGLRKFVDDVKPLENFKRREINGKVKSTNEKDFDPEASKEYARKKGFTTFESL